MHDPASFRAEFPVLARRAYLNAGTCGPVPARAARAAAEAIGAEAEGGRSGQEHFARLGESAAALRAGYARWLGCEPGCVALTTSTSAGVNTVVSGLGLRQGDEVLTSDEEHPGVLAPLASARERFGIEVRVVPFDSLAGAVTSRTRLVACSHVSWVSGQVVDAVGLAASEAPVLLDGAQGLGALELDMAALGCDFYAASGQKWMCGPDGTGCLYVRPGRVEALGVPFPSYASLAGAADPLDLDLHEGARRFDLGSLPSASVAWALASLELLDGAGGPWVTARAAELAARLAAALSEGGREVLPRGDTTLVSWRDAEASTTVAGLAEAGIVVRELPGRGLVRASVGAWSSEEELDRLAGLACATA
ncbi:MAG: aminotransferase class V-fold PLP-dependent enzyme [Thermoleophilaceae bacterium]